MKNWKTIGLIATIIIVLSVPLSVLKTRSFNDSNNSEEATFVGSSKCMECHINEFNSWQKSHHAHAMEVATDSSVLGDFDNIEYNDGYRTHTFFKKNDKFYVNTLGPEGKFSDFEITHTFGYAPLQQYLIPFEKGKYQCLHIAWNTEEKTWFNMSDMVYGEDIHHTDWLHWTEQGQNWNGMCAECHSTNVKKNYYHEADSFHTTYSEINVGCEACHGPGSDHMKWAWLPEDSRSANSNFGLIVKSSSVTTEEYVDLCARCHSRRGQVRDFDHSFENIYDYMLPSRLGENYHADGQILDEDYVFGSYLQSKMYHTDIKCNDCHDVHSGERFFDGNKLCFQCHTQDYYGSAKHHFHKLPGETGNSFMRDEKLIEVGEGSQCINCHMPPQYYMGIDSRNDHSIRIPDPNLSKTIGVPNACNQCHTDKSIDWSIQYYTKWYGIKSRPHYGEILALGREQNPEGEWKLIRLLNDTLYPEIVRATAIDYLGQYTSDTAMLVIQNYLDDPKPILRHAAITAFNSSNMNDYFLYIAPLLNDPHRVIRAQSAIKLSVIPEEQLPARFLSLYKSAIKEYKENNEYMADFPTGRMNLGIMYSNQGDFHQAKTQYERAIEIDDQLEPAKLNLAMVHNRLGENDKAEKVYKQLIASNPDFSGIYYSLGLLLAEEKRYAEAAEYLEIATQKNQENARIYYNLALIYQQIGKLKEAEKHLLKTVEIAPANFDYLYALSHFYLSIENISAAKKYARVIQEHFPNNPTGQQLVEHIQNQ